MFPFSYIKEDYKEMKSHFAFPQGIPGFFVKQMCSAPNPNCLSFSCLFRNVLGLQKGFFSFSKQE